jgi:hypothetical protein
MWVMHIQLNAHSEGLVSNARIAYSIKCHSEGLVFYASITYLVKCPHQRFGF